MRRRVLFVLTMPDVASWDGKWSGEGNRYAVVRQLPQPVITDLGIRGERFAPVSWRHNWKDGWCAEVSARLMQKGERLGKTLGFYGYDWMVDNILEYGRTEACLQESDHNWQPEREGWERCRKCRTSQRGR